MLSIRQIARLLGLAPQTIRMYEQYGIFHSNRNDRNYRLFGRHEVSTLIKSRMLQGLGFSMKEIADISKGVSFQESQKTMHQQAQKIEKEICLLQDKHRHLVRLINEHAEIRRKPRYL